MLPKELKTLHRTIDRLIERFELEPFAERLRKAMAPRVSLFASPWQSGALGDLHTLARKYDRSIKADFDKAYRVAAGDDWNEIIRSHHAKAIKPGASKIGGTPDLPASLDWPQAKGQALPFIGQINLADVPRWPGMPLPKTGRLYFFAGGDFPIETRVIHDSSRAASLRLTKRPPDEAMRCGEFVRKPEYQLVHIGIHALSATFPSYGSDFFDKLTAGKNSERTDDFFDLLTELHRFGGDGEETPDVQLLGLDLDDNGRPYSECVRYAKRRGSDWTLLASFRSAGSMCWGDVGSLSFLIRQSHLEAGNFDSVYAVIESS